MLVGSDLNVGTENFCRSKGGGVFWGVQAMGVQVAGARKLKSKAEGRGARRRRH